MNFKIILSIIACLVMIGMVKSDEPVTNVVNPTPKVLTDSEITKIVDELLARDDVKLAMKEKRTVSLYFDNYSFNFFKFLLI